MISLTFAARPAGKQTRIALAQRPRPASIAGRAVNPPRRAQFAATASPEQVPATRRWAESTLAYWGISAEQRDNAVLVVSELATNAALHGGSEMDVRLAYVREELHITVSDSGRKAPLRSLDFDADECGRGLQIVSYLARSVRVLPRVGGGCLAYVVMPAQAAAGE